MRVGVVTTSYPREPGDPAGNFVAGHAQWLASRGHHVEVIAAGPGAPAIDGVAVRRVASGGLFYRGGAPEALEAGGRWTDALVFSAAMAREVARAGRGWDRAFAHWLVPSAACAALALPRRIPLTAIAHSGDVHLLNRMRASSAVAALLAARAAKICFVADAVRDRFASEIAPRALRRRVLGSSVVCAMGIDAERLHAQPTLAPASRDGAPVVLFLGRLVPVKGADVLFDALDHMRERARIVIAGDGPLRAELELRARNCPDRIAVIGEVRGAERDRWLARASVVVVPSRQLPSGRTEGMPLVALEAMAAGVPVVASAVGGLAEMPLAARIPPDDAGALAAALDRVLSACPDVRAAREFARRHDWSAVGPRLNPPS